MLSSLPLQVCIYFNNWYNAFFTLVMIVLYIWKGTTLPYPPELSGLFSIEVVLIFILAGIEYSRLFLASSGNKTERAGPLIFALVLSLPSIVAYIYYLLLQVHARAAAGRARTIALAPSQPPLPHTPALSQPPPTPSPTALRDEARGGHLRDRPRLHRRRDAPLPPHDTHLPPSALRLRLTAPPRRRAVVSRPGLSTHEVGGREGGPEGGRWDMEVSARKRAKK